MIKEIVDFIFVSGFLVIAGMCFEFGRGIGKDIFESLFGKKEADNGNNGN